MDESMSGSGDTLTSPVPAASSSTFFHVASTNRLRRDARTAGRRDVPSIIHQGHRAGPHMEAMGRAMLGEQGQDDASTSARLMRQRFRQRCQDAMARERQRDRSRRLEGISRGVVGSDVSEHFTDESRTSDGTSTGYERSAAYESADEEEESLRRQMLAEYRTMMHEQEQQGHLALGWLGEEELEWLEEEYRREQVQQTARHINTEQEPPPDMIDEDEDLCAMYEHSQQRIHVAHSANTTPIREEDDFSWIHDDDLIDLDMA